jgi:hypothetical protein
MLHPTHLTPADRPSLLAGTGDHRAEGGRLRREGRPRTMHAVVWGDRFARFAASASE